MYHYSLTQKALTQAEGVKISYQKALARYRTQRGLSRTSWVTWLIVIGTTLIWLWTTYNAALMVGVHSWDAILTFITRNAITIQPGDDQAISNALLVAGAKDNSLILHGQYWRFLTPIFLHVNAIHLGLNMFNLLFLGVYIERLAGHIRLLLIYLVTGVISIIASFWFSPYEISVGASGALFGLVGAYSAFIVRHRHAMPRHGIPAIIELLIVIGLNLGIGLIIPNVDNAAHLGGLSSGLVMGWLFMPYYRASFKPVSRSQSTPIIESETPQWLDSRRLSVSWPLAFLTIFGTLLLILIALSLNATKS